jgi:uncharacterized protein
LLVAASLLLLAGCTASASAAGGNGSDTAEISAQPSSAARTPARLLANLGRRDRERKVIADANSLAPLLNRFWGGELFRLYGISFDPPDRLEYYHGSEATTCGGRQGDQSRNAFYCPVSYEEKVDFDIDWFQQLLRRNPGDATTFLILAHEWGHAVQDTWEESGGPDTWVPPGKELNADCLAGVFLARSIENGTIIEEADDARAIFGLLYELGNAPWLGRGSHGTREERQLAFRLGTRYGTDYCRVNY